MSTYEYSMDSETLLTRMRTLNKKFKNACSQVILLNNQIEYLQVRYDRAVKANKRSYRYFLRLRLATLEGIRNMFYEYACRRADQLDEMQDQLVQEGVIDSDYDMDDDGDQLYTIADAQVASADAHSGLVYASADVNSVTVLDSANGNMYGSDTSHNGNMYAPSADTSIQSTSVQVTLESNGQFAGHTQTQNLHEVNNTAEEITQESSGQITQAVVQEPEISSDLNKDLGLLQSESLFQQNSLNPPTAAFVELYSGINEGNLVLSGENNQQTMVLTGEKGQSLNPVLPSSSGEGSNKTLLAGSSRGSRITEDIQRQTLGSQSDCEEYTVQAKSPRLDTEENMNTDQT